MSNLNNIRFISWNVNGVRACILKGMKQSLSKLNPDIICLQEIKADDQLMQQIAAHEFPEFTLYNSSAVKKGYSGVATLVRKEIEIEDHLTVLISDNYPDNSQSLLQKSSPCEREVHNQLFADEGRFSIIRTKLYTLFNIYIPSGTSGESRQSLKYVFLDNFLAHLRYERTRNVPIIICGDFNICHKEIDIHHPKVAEQRRLTGYLPEERAWIDTLIELGFVDCYRLKAGDRATAYTWWSYRANSREKNLGWRIDYFFCSRELANCLSSVKIHSDISGSDHCPISADFCMG